MKIILIGLLSLLLFPNLLALPLVFLTAVFLPSIMKYIKLYLLLLPVLMLLVQDLQSILARMNVQINEMIIFVNGFLCTLHANRKFTVTHAYKLLRLGHFKSEDLLPHRVLKILSSCFIIYH